MPILQIVSLLLVTGVKLVTGVTKMFSRCIKTVIASNDSGKLNSFQDPMALF